MPCNDTNFGIGTLAAAVPCCQQDCGLELGEMLKPILQLPLLELPGRKRFQPPLDPALRRPMAETRGLLDHLLDRTGHDAAVPLLGRLADHIDEFGLVGHGYFPRHRRAGVARQVCSQLLNDSLPRCLDLSTGAVNAKWLRSNGRRALVYCLRMISAQTPFRVCREGKPLRTSR